MVMREAVYIPTKLRRMGPQDLSPPLCPGCSHHLMEKVVCEVLEEMGLVGKAIGVAGIGCSYPFFLRVNVDGVNCAHGAAPAVATGIKHSRPGNPLVFTVQGDGDCLAIGGGYLLNAAARAEKITIIMVNNATYGTTGGQMAPTTLLGMVASTAPEGRVAELHGYPVHAPELLAGMRGVAYAARGALNSAANYQRCKKYLATAFQKQMENAGLTFVEFLGVCPPNWHLSPIDALKFLGEKIIAEYPLGEFKK